MATANSRPSAAGADAVTHRVPGLALRLIGALLAVTTYALMRDQLDPVPLVAARFGLGITLFALLVDVGRSLAGAAPPLVGEIGPHRQRAEPLVDEGYRDVHHAVRRFLDDGVYTDRYEVLMLEALDARGVTPAERNAGLARARNAAQATPPGERHWATIVASGAAAVLGTAAALGVLLDAAALPLASPLLAIVGLGTGLLMGRTVSAGERWATLALGLVGALLLFLGATGLRGAYGSGWMLAQGAALALAAGALALAFLYSFRRPAWREVRERLTRELSQLRRAFVAALLAGIVLFPFKPLLAALFGAVGWSFEVPYKMAVIGYATVVAFLAVELAGAYLALGRGERRAARLRRGRVEANEALLTLIEQRTAGGRPT